MSYENRFSDPDDNHPTSLTDKQVGALIRKRLFNGTEIRAFLVTEAFLHDRGMIDILLVDGKEYHFTLVTKGKKIK